MSFFAIILGTMLFAGGVGFALESLIFRLRNGTNPYDRFL